MKLNPFLVLLVVSTSVANTRAADLEFNRDIRPILAANCFSCHGPDAKARQANLRLDSFKVATADLGGHTAIVPKQPTKSELVTRINSSDNDQLMPPPETGHRLTAQQKRTLENWIRQGSAYDKHWSFVAPVKRPLPNVKQRDWTKNEIDRFILASIEQAGGVPAKQADPYRLIRRLSLDLTGLPPTVAEADAFAAQPSQEAYEKAVARLLASPSFGEHWARMWLDLARYADTKGYEKDRPRTIWRYRDWVIDALNRDMPYDEFTLHQLAGDLLPNATTDHFIATAFHRNTMTNEEGGTDDEEFRVAAVKDRVDTTMQVWMGLTMGCSKCHSHKYDPITIEDYYSFYAIFNQTRDADRESPTLPTPTKAQRSHVVDLEKQLAAATDKQQKKKLTAQLTAYRKGFPTTPILRELPANKQRVTRVHLRGNFREQAKETLASRLPTAFGAPPSDIVPNRITVARWLCSNDNPLTARVMVNRVWARLFGIGIVETEEDFGSQGTYPSHPELLDWLAVEFRQQKWSLKSLLRKIVLSAIYRQSAVVTNNGLTDPRNRLLARGARFRLSAETVRDQSLAASGLLTRKLGGPSVFPPQPPGVWKSTYNTIKWVNATDENRYRRALYTFLKRTSPHPAMTAFDAGSGEVCQIRRVRTNTPLQSLVTLNDPAFLEAAGALATKMTASSTKLEEQITHGFRRVLIRKPQQAEVRRLAELYQALNGELDASEFLAAAGLKQGDAALVAVASVILNLDEALVKP